MSNPEKRDCIICGKTLDLTEENFRPYSNGTLRKRCRKCEYAARKPLTETQKTQARERRKGAEYKEKKRQWNLNFKQRSPNYQQDYYEINKDEIKRRRKEIHKNDTGKAQLRDRAKIQRRRERVLSSSKLSTSHVKKTWNLVKKQNRRAVKRNLPATFTKLQWGFAIDYFNGCCAVCGRPLRDLFGTHTAAVDHWIPLSSPECPGTVPTNIVPLCHGVTGCNNSKSNKDATQWLIERFGKHRAREILKRIETYFEWVKQFND